MLSNTQKQFDRWVFIIGLSIFIIMLILSGQSNWSRPIQPALSALSTLKGNGGPNDIAQDIVGFRNLVKQENPYPLLGPAFRELGLIWDVKHESTHPPTAFLLVAPIAFFPWKLASAIWAWFMLVLLFFTIRCYQKSWKATFGLTIIALLWPPIATSLHQFTIIWLFAVVAGYRLEKRHMMWSGITVGLASLTKYFPSLLIISFILKKQWRALLGYILVWIFSLVVLVLISPTAIYHYLEVNRTASPLTIWRDDNSSLLIFGYHLGGFIGIILICLFFFSISWANKSCFQDPELSSSPKLWELLSYFSVALLPISWVYSLAPLLPIIISLISRKKLSTMAIGYFCIVIPFCFPIWGIPSVIPLALVNFSVGIGLLIDGLPFRLFTAATLKDLFHPMKSIH